MGVVDENGKEKGVEGEKAGSEGDEKKIGCVWRSAKGRGGSSNPGRG